MEERRGGLARALGYREVPPGFAGVVYTLGFITRVIRTPGPTWIIPIFERMVLVDQREQLLNVPTEAELYTADRRPVKKADVDVYFRIQNPVSALTKVKDLISAITGLVDDARRDAIARIPEEELTDVHQQTNIRNAVIARLREPTERWGIVITEAALSDLVRHPEIDMARARQQAAFAEADRIQTLSRAEIEAFQREVAVQGPFYLRRQELDAMVEASRKEASVINIVGLAGISKEISDWIKRLTGGEKE